MSPLVWASLATALAVAALVRLVFPPTPKLAPRVRPYAIGSRTALGGSADVRALTGLPTGALRGVFGPVLASMARAVGRVVDQGGDEELARRIRQAGLYPELAEPDRLAAYRIRQLVSIGGWALGGAAVALLLGLNARTTVSMLFLGLIVGATRQRGALERAITERQDRMRIEIYTVNQLLAVRARSGGGVIQAVSQFCERARGEVVGELRDALRMHRAGARASEAFHRIAEQTPEPYCARTYGLLAIAEERGVDLAEGLLALSEDVREGRREAIRRSATRRRAASLIPTIAILAPVMLLFVGAPLPRLILGWQ